MSVYGTPAAWQVPLRNEKVTAGLFVQRRPGGHDIAAECRILKQVKIAFLPNHRGEMI
ncbi:hypothetical protein [Paraburkholderia kirstenboschensis]|uniref:hypothetical protein n=1 Tax=Paraburkholderia kirstenboschensis TaxID=1245436 RepID=UPI0013E33B81|nr:hypothetical protein [Paraburkholderia kirstenboschensis]